jgi:hypothetical protein
MTTSPDRLFHSGGIPVDSGTNPIFGKVWWVDGTNGSTSGPGDTPDTAFNTVQLAITAQLAAPSALGDVIYVMTGTYSEAVVASTFTKAQLIGATCGGEPRAVIIHNSAGHAFVAGADDSYTTSMNNAALRNICFYSPGSSNREFAAVRIDTIQNSIIDNCQFFGNFQDGAGSITTVGLQLGPLTVGKWMFSEHSTISNNEFGTSGARAKEVDTAIRVGASGETTPAGNGFSSMKIIDNLIFAEHYGIQMYTGGSSCGGSLIARNVFHSHQGGGGINNAVHCHSTDGDDVLMGIHDNKINYKTSWAAGFSTRNLHGNTVSIDSANPVGQYPPAS